MHDGETIFDVTYNFDSYFRRKVPSSPVKGADDFVLFFGGSQTFGEGLAENDTIPARVQAASGQSSVYNYAYKGYGPHQMLKKLQIETLASELDEHRGITFYQYFGFHLQRVLGTMSYIGWAGGGAPYYQISENGEIEYRGSFASGQFGATSLYWLLSKSAIAQHFQVDLPNKITSEHHNLLCAVVNTSKASFMEQFPDSRFIVIVSFTNGKQDQIVDNCLEPNAIEFIDLRGLEAGKDNSAFPHNGHFMPEANHLIAEQLTGLLEM